MGLNKRLIGAGATAGAGGLTPSENFKVVLYTGDGTSSQFIDVGFTPDFVWIKGRNTSDYHNLIDSSRTAGCFLNSNVTNGEDCNSAHAQIQTNGFNAKGNPNASNINYVAWCWKANGGTTSSNTDGNITSTVQANTDAGFSIIKYTGTGGSTQTVGHGLSQKPDFLIVKNRDSATGWKVWHEGLTPGGAYVVELQDTTGEYSNASPFDSTEPGSSVFTVADFSYSDTNATGADYIAYAFHSVDNFSKFGSYTGNGSANGPIVETGFEPAFLMIKNKSDTGDWVIFDNKRNLTNPRNNRLMANLGSAESTGSTTRVIDFLSNGFTIKSTHQDINANNDTYIYMAFAADPDTEAPTLASSFNIETYTGTGSSQSITGLGFQPNFVWLKSRSFADNYYLQDSVRGATRRIHSNLDVAEQSPDATRFTSLDSDGFTLGGDASVNGNGEDFVAWSWKADDNEPTLRGGNAAAVYKFEDNYNDVTGTYNGSGTSGTSFISGGKFNKAAAFSGTSSNMDTGITARNFESWSFWFKPGSSNTGYRVLVCTNTSGDVGQNFEYSSSNAFYIVDILGGATNNNTSVTVDLRDGNWHHIVLTKTATKFTAYLNKEEKISVNNATGSSLQKGNEWSFGKGNYGDANSDFAIDQARYYEGVLEQEDIDKLYIETAPDNDDLSYGAPKETITSTNANAGFSIVKYEGTGIAGTKVPHGLSSAPSFILAKRLNSAKNWAVFHTSIGATKYLELNDTRAEDTASTVWNDTAPSATTVTFGTSTLGNGSGDDYIMYCFHDVTGYSKFGSYTGTGATGNTVTVGFKPDFVMVKSSSTTEPWFILDSKRDTGNPRDNRLMADSNAAEDDGSVHTMDFNSTSFTLNGTLGNGTNGNGETYIYWAVAKNVPSNTTLANSFKAITYTGTGNDGLAITGVGFRPDMVWIKNRDLTRDHNLADAVQGPGKEITPNLNEAQENRSVTSFDSDGFTLDNASGNYNDTSDFIAWCWKAGNTWQSNVDGTIGSITNTNTANGFSIVKYTGTGANTTVGHNLGAAPEMVIVKNLSNSHSGSAHWAIYHTNLGATKVVYLNRTNAAGTSSAFWNDTAPSSTVFSIGTDNDVNVSGEEFIAYCFNSVSGYSKIGSYTGNGSTQSITGLGFQPDFVMIKGVSSGGAGDWYIFDSERNAQNYLRANLSNAESTGASSTLTSFDSDGFSLGNDGFLNGNTYTYIYMAFKMN
jgi:hypothetical protein